MNFVNSADYIIASDQIINPKSIIFVYGYVCNSSTGGIYELEVSESIQTLIASYNNTVIRDLILHIGNADPKSAVRNVNGQVCFCLSLILKQVILGVE